MNFARMFAIIFLGVGAISLPANASSCNTTCYGNGNYRTCNTYCY